LERQDKGCSKGYERKMKAAYTKIRYTSYVLCTVVTDHVNIASTSIASKNLPGVVLADSIYADFGNSGKPTGLHWNP
jgi:hypothetical protein